VFCLLLANTKEKETKQSESKHQEAAATAVSFCPDTVGTSATPTTGKTFIGI